MNFLKQNNAPPRFTRAQLEACNLTKQQLEEFKNVTPYTKHCQEVLVAKTNLGVNHSLNTAEFDMVIGLLRDMVEKKVVDYSDFFSQAICTNDVFFSQEGLMAMEGPELKDRKVLAKAATWILPEEVGLKRPGITNLAGVAVTTIKKDAGILQPFVDIRTYSQLAFGTVDIEKLESFARMVIGIISPYYQQTEFSTGNGRTFIVEVLKKLQVIPIKDYFALHVLMAQGPLQHCFHWGILNANGTVTPTLDGQFHDFILGVKEEYLPYFSDVGKTSVGKEMLEEHKFGNCVPIWTKAFSSIGAAEPSHMGLSEAHQYLALCRTQRLTDEKGLSAFSCGYGACGNPTKSQLRLNRKISIILGLLLSQDTRPVVIHDTHDSELPLLHAFLMVWITKKDIRKRFYYQLSTKQLRFMNDIDSIYLFGSGFEDPVHHVYFDDYPIPARKADQWPMVEREVVLHYTALLEGEFLKTRREQIAKEWGMTQGQEEDYVYDHHTIYGPVAASAIFDNLSVYTLGSCHNMYAVMSTLSGRFPFASSDGTSIWQLSLKEDLPIATAAQFAKKVCQHNGARSAFFLSGAYFFNTRLNMLRRIKDKTVDFVTAKIVHEDRFEVTDTVSYFDPRAIVETFPKPAPEPQKDQPKYSPPVQSQLSSSGNSSNGAPLNLKSNKKQKKNEEAPKPAWVPKDTKLAEVPQGKEVAKQGDVTVPPLLSAMTSLDIDLFD